MSGILCTCGAWRHRDVPTCPDPSGMHAATARLEADRAERDRFRGLLEECRNFLRMVEGGDALRLADALKSALDGSRGVS